MANEYTGTGETVPLTLSSDGQANPYHVKLAAAGYYRFVVVAASGTVEVYRWLSDTSFLYHPHKGSYPCSPHNNGKDHFFVVVKDF